MTTEEKTETKATIELRQKKDGSWSVWLLEQGFIPCPGVCNLKQIDRQHKCKREPELIESYFGVRGISCPEPDTSFEAAMDFAKYMRGSNESREIKVVKAK